MNSKVRYSLASVAAAVEAMVLVTATARGAGATLPPAAAFPFAGSDQTYTVPTGVCGVRIEVEGAAGGSNYPLFVGGHGGSGSAEFAVLPGDVLTITVGGLGSHRTSPQNPAWITGGFGGGGQPASQMAGGGGGATTVISGSTTLIVAGGGGGRGWPVSVGLLAGNGGDAGQPGSNGATGGVGDGGGGGGSLIAGGAGGTGTYQAGVSGTRGVGGNGLSWMFSYGAGAGGGGYFGGGSGGAGTTTGLYASPASGGGGSGFVASAATNVGTWAGHAGTTNGSAAITPTADCPSAPTTVITLPSSTTVLGADPEALVPAFAG